MRPPKPEMWELTHHPDYYVSTRGRVRSFKNGRDRVLKTLDNGAGYSQIWFYTQARRKKVYVHRLVARAFLGPCPPGQVVRHKDDNPRNCAVENLEYGTPAQNVADTNRRGRRNDAFGARNPNTKLMVAQIPEIKQRLRSGDTQSAIARDFGVTQATIRNILIGRSWRYV